MKRTGFVSYLMVAFVVAIGMSAKADLTDGLIAYWTFDEGDGATLHDATSGHDGAIDGATWTEGYDGTALDFAPAKESRVMIPHDNAFDVLPDGFTIANWALPRGRGSMFDKSKDDGARRQWFILDDARIHWGVGGGFGFAPGPEEFGQWAHVAITHNAEGLSIPYLDGVAVGEEQLAAVPATEVDCYIGDRVTVPANANEQNFDGIIDEMAFWNRALSAEEINEVMGGALKSQLAVSPHGRLATTWAALKPSH